METAIRELGAANDYNSEEIEQAIKGTGKGGPNSQIPLGFDHNYVLDNYNPQQGYANCPLRPIAKLYHRESGRCLKVSATTPGV